MNKRHPLRQRVLPGTLEKAGVGPGRGCCYSSPGASSGRPGLRTSASSTVPLQEAHSPLLESLFLPSQTGVMFC